MSRVAVETPTPARLVGGAYAWYALGVLFLVYVVNFIERQLLSILAQDIKHALAIREARAVAAGEETQAKGTP